MNAYTVLQDHHKVLRGLVKRIYATQRLPPNARNISTICSSNWTSISVSKTTSTTRRSPLPAR